MENIAINTVTKKSATELALENLQAYIESDSVDVGSKFPTEKDLCNMLGVGRGTVRETVKILVSRGMLEIRPGLGTYLINKSPVNNDSLNDWFLKNEVALQDLMVVRSAIEPLATHIAVERCTEEQLSVLRRNMENAQKASDASDSAELARLDEEFHRTIFEIAGNVLMIEINDMVMKLLAQFRQNTFKIQKNVENFIPAHAAIVRGFEMHDPSFGEKTMRKHLKKVQQDLESSKYNA